MPSSKSTARPRVHRRICASLDLNEIIRCVDFLIATVSIVGWLSWWKLHEKVNILMVFPSQWSQWNFHKTSHDIINTCKGDPRHVRVLDLKCFRSESVSEAVLCLSHFIWRNEPKDSISRLPSLRLLNECRVIWHRKGPGMLDRYIGLNVRRSHDVTWYRFIQTMHDTFS